MATAKVKNAMFFKVKDGAFGDAEGIITGSSFVALATRYKPSDQTIVFFAAARRVGQDAEALSLCKMLVERGIDINHGDELDQTALFYAARQGHADTIRYLISKGANPNVIDKNGETAMFFAVLNKRTAAVKALLEGGARLDVINNWHHTCTSIAPDEVLPVLQEERQKKRRFDESGPGPKRRRTPAEELRAWADEWPIKERVIGNEIAFAGEDIIAAKNTGKGIGKSGEYAVLRKCPAESAARIRLSEKQFVLDHAVMMKSRKWFKNLKPEDWCQDLAVITDANNAVEGIKGVVTGRNSSHFTLPLVQTGNGTIAGYVHASYSSEEQELSIDHLKVDEGHTGRGLGGLLLEAAEQHSQSIGWKCRNTSLSVLKANVRARRCYEKAGFRVAFGSAATWGKKEHVWSEWQKLRKVHKSALKTSAAARVPSSSL